jgi:hypothetical protein
LAHLRRIARRHQLLGLSLSRQEGANAENTVPSRLRTAVEAKLCNRQELVSKLKKTCCGVFKSFGNKHDEILKEFWIAKLIAVRRK